MPQYSELRKVLAPQYRRLPAEDIEALLESYNLSAEDMEGFFDTLKDIGKAVVSAAPTILPVAGTVVGTAFGGPLGGALGATLGRVAGGAISQATAPSPRPPAAPQLPRQIPGASPAAAQLMQTMFRPETMRALGSMLLGQLGRPTTQIGSTPVPVGALTNLLGMLAGQAQAEYAAFNPQVAEALPGYLRDYAGEAVGDPAVAESRARVVYELLQESDPERDEPESVAAARMMAEDQYYDYLELAELYVSDELL